MVFAVKRVPYLFLRVGISAETWWKLIGNHFFCLQQWFNLYAPTTLAIDMANVEQKAQQKPNSTERNKSATNLPFNSLDVKRLFRGKTDKGMSKLSQAKKPPLGKTQNASQV